MAARQGEGEKVVMLLYFNLNDDFSAVKADLINLLDTGLLLFMDIGLC